MKEDFMAVVLKGLVVAEDLETSASGRRRGRRVRAYAAWLAGRMGIPVRLVHSMDFQRLAREPFQVPGSFERHLEGQEKRLKVIAAGMRGKTAGNSVFLYGNPVEAILKYLEPGPSSLLTLGTHGLKGMKHLLLGSVAEELVRRSKNPVLVLGPGVAAGSKGSRSGQIFLATTLDKSSRPSEEFAVKLAGKLRLGIKLYHCVNATLPVATFADPALAGSLEAYSSLLADLVEDRKKALKRLAVSLRARGISCTPLLDMRSQSPVPAILRESRGASLIILGRHTRGRITQAFFGSTARSLFLRSHLPVISVPER